MTLHRWPCIDGQWERANSRSPLPPSVTRVHEKGIHYLGWRGARDANTHDVRTGDSMTLVLTLVLTPVLTPVLTLAD
jgi:hypothetical protein